MGILSSVVAMMAWQLGLSSSTARTITTIADRLKDALFAEYTAGQPLPTALAAFMRLVEAGWDAEAARRPQRANAPPAARITTGCITKARSTITGPPTRSSSPTGDGNPLTSASLARQPTKPPPDVSPWTGPLGGRADWW
ncbi:hypothetical protein A5724_05690 [Mycobacterium sp. ACS1612]|nr:hypothetical protein A5724_05690 [Mycobacterium sp. ACS1612]